MKKAKPTLSLKAETVRRLSTEELRAAAGGRYYNVCTTAASYCECDSSSTIRNSHCCDEPPADYTWYR